MWTRLATAIASMLVDKLFKAVMAWLTRWYEERKTNEEIKKKVKRLRAARSEEEIRDAINNINL